MLSVDEVWSLIDREVAARCRRSACRSAGRSGAALPRKFVADADMPAFCRSAIDGYALPEGSEPGWFRIIERGQAGDAAICSLRKRVKR